MMNKKFLIAMTIVSFLFANSANAAILPSSDMIAPDSPFYFLQTWKESIQTFFTFGLENKAKQYLHLAEVRLDEYQKMIEKGKTEIAERTLEKYEKQLNNALQKTEELKSKGKDITDLSQKIEETATKHLEVLQTNLQKVPEQAKKGIENAIENSQKVLQKISKKPVGKPCTQEAKQCPDGSYVGRTGPNCEFAACPNEYKVYFVDELVKSNIKEGTEVLVKGRYNAQLISAGSDYEGPGGGYYLFVETKSIFIGDTELKNAALGQIITVKGKIDYCGGKKIPKYICALTESELVPETADWKTYRNEKYGFEMKYPQNFQQISKDQDITFFGLAFGEYDAEKNLGNFVKFTIIGLTTVALDNGAPCDAKNYTLQLAKEKNMAREEVKMSDKSAEAWKVSYAVPPPGRSGSEIYISKVNCDQLGIREIMLFESGSGPLGKNLNSGIIANQILSTFKFIER